MGRTGAVHEWGNSCCHLLSFSGSGLFKRPLTRLLATHSLAGRTVPCHHGTTIRINPRTCAESTVGVCLFCEAAWEGGRGGGGGDGELCERTLASHSLLLSKAAGARMNEAMW